MAYREAEIAAEANRGRSPRDWTIERNGQKYGLDSQYIYLGKFKLPSAILAALPFNYGGVDGTRIIQARNATGFRTTSTSHSQGMSEDDFRAAVKRIRERKDRERKEAEDKEQAEGRLRSSPERSAHGRQLSSSPTGIVGCWLLLAERTEDAAHHAEHREVVARADFDRALGVVRRLEHDRRAAMRERLHRRVVAETRRDDVAVLRARRRRDHHVVAVEDAAADHAVALHLEHEHVVARQEAAIHRDEAVAMLGSSAGSPA